MVEPLKKIHHSTGKGYSRLAPIEAMLVQLESMSRDTIVARAEIRGRSDPDYLPSECLVHLIRARRRDNSERYFKQLYDLLLARVLRALPNPNAAADTTALTPERIREKVVGRFNELLAADRETYVERLDFFEVRFDSALARLRSDASEQVWRDENRNVQLTLDEETGEPTAEVERAAGPVDPAFDDEFGSADYRSRLDAAIDTLPPEQIRIITMLRDDFPIDSRDPAAVTISRSLGKSEKTIRLQRDKAYAAIRAYFAGERP